MIQGLSFRHATRIFRTNPIFCCVVVLTLSVGIGATTAVFSFIYDAIIRPLPYPNANRLVRLYESATPNDETNAAQVAPANFLDWQKQLSTFDAIGAECGFTYNLTGRGLPRLLAGVATSASYMDALQVKPQLGRYFSAVEDRPDAAHVAVLSDRVWRRYFEGDPTIIGRSIGLNGESYEVIGVLPPNELVAEERDYDVWIPLQQQVRPDRMLWRNVRYLTVIGRLKPGTTVGQARAELNQVSAGIRVANGDQDIDSGAVVVPLQKALTRGIESELYIAFGIVGIVLLVASANTTNLMLVRVDSRARELAVRMALGASKVQIVTQLLLETLALAIPAAVGGLALAYAGEKVLAEYTPGNEVFVGAAHLNIPVLCFALTVCLATATIVGLLPVLTVTKPAVQDVLRRATTRSSGDRSAKRWLNAIAVSEIAMAVVLAMAAGLLVRSLTALGDTPVGFQTKNLLSVRVQLPRIKYQQDRDVVAFAKSTAEQLRRIPSVDDVAQVDHLPLTGSEFGTTFSLGSTQDNEHLPWVRLRLVNERYFKLLAIPVMNGRSITDLDQTDSQPIAVVSDAMAKKFWPNQNPIGQTITATRADVNGAIHKHVIVGVVGDVRDQINEEPQPTLYIPFSQMSFPTMQFILHTRSSVGALDESVRHAVQSVDEGQPVTSMVPMDDLLTENVAPWKFALLLEGMLAGLAVLLTMIGIFAVIEYQVRQRTKEFGVRLAVGASPGQILASVLRGGAGVSTMGVAIGVIAAVVLSRFVRSLVYGVHEYDPLTLSIVGLFTFTIALLACFIPARRASKVEPISALRED